MGWKSYGGIKPSWWKFFFHCFVFFHKREYTKAADCQPPQLLVHGVDECQRCGSQVWY